MARFRQKKHLLLLLLTLALGCFFWPVRSLRSDTYYFYLANQRHSVSSESINGIDYLPVLGLLNVVGPPNWEEKRNTLRIRVGGNQLELHLDKNRLKLGKTEYSLSSPVRIANGQWLVPADFITSILPRLVPQPVHYNPATRNVVIGNTRLLSYSVRLDPVPNGARLTLQFTGPVTLRTVSRNGQWVLYLGNTPVEPPRQVYRFDSPYVREVDFDDRGGLPKLIITPGAAPEGLNFYIRMTPDLRSATAEVVTAPPTTAQQAIPQGARQPVPPGASVRPNPSAAPAEAHPEVLLPAVVLDAGHGGPDAGARGNGILEKDVVAQLTERVRQALATTRKYRVVQTRVGEANPGYDDRALAANTARPIAFISFHAGSFGDVVPRIAVYTYQPPSWRGSAEEAASLETVETRPLFVPWGKVQEFHLDRSRQLARALADQFVKISGVSIQGPTGAPVRVLRSIDAPAAAVEIGSLTPNVDAAPLTDSGFQQQIANAVAQVLGVFQGGRS